MEIRCGLVYMSWLSEQEILAASSPAPQVVKSASLLKTDCNCLRGKSFSYQFFTSVIPKHLRGSVCAQSITFNKATQISCRKRMDA